MSMTEIPLRLPTDIVNAMRTIAQGEDMKVGDFIRSIVASEVLRRADMPGNHLQNRDVLAALRMRLGRLLAETDALDELNASLKELGFVLRQDGSGYTLHTWPVLRPVCNAMDLGMSQSRLLALDPEPDVSPLSGWPLAKALIKQADARKRA